MSEVPFPLKDQEEYGDVASICERAGVELRTVDGEEGIPFCCGQRMQVKAGIMGPDYARCNECRLEVENLASPHINGGIVLNEEIILAHGERMWRARRRGGENETTAAEGGE